MNNTMILVAEDNTTNRELIRELLHARGYGILEASDGEEALALAKGNKPALALIDIQMPKLDGLQLVRLIRQDPEIRTLPTVALTAFAMRGDREIAIEQGFDGYVTKPISFPLLLTEIERCLAVANNKQAISRSA
jgi:two-component system, cell cycle response regulator DivK